MNNKNDAPEHILKVQRASIKYSLFKKENFKILWKTMPGRVKQVPQDSTE